MRPLDRAHQAFERHDWEAARAAYEEALAEETSGEAVQNLAMSLFWLGDVDGSFQAMERAYAEFRHEGRQAQAALAALWLAGQYVRVRANPAAAGGWARRCESLLAAAEAKPGPELGRVLLIRALATGDWTQIEESGERARQMARGFGDSDGELLALAYTGLALVCTGRVREGLERLDEAMAAASSGEVRAPDAVGQIFCALLAGCERTTDLQRAELWSQVAGPFISQYAGGGFTGTCRATYAGVLISTGRWEDAERELLLALGAFENGARGMRGDALTRLAALRLRQGRIDEAEGLLEGQHSHPDAQGPLAGLEMTRGRPKVAAAILERRTRQLGQADVQAAPLLLRLVEAHIAAEDIDAAREAAERLRELVVPGLDSAGGLAALATGLVQRAQGADAQPELERALMLLERAGLALEAAEARLAVAESLAASNPDFAGREARATLATLSAIGARPTADRAAGLLRRLGRAVPPGPRTAAVLSRREEEVARLVGVGMSNEQIAGQLFLSPRTVEHHVTSILRKLDLTRRTEIAAYAARALGARSV